MPALHRKKLIGVFDSGFGGISILRGIVKELPAYSYLYLGDTARVPYGNRSSEVVYEFTKQAVDFLFANNCELVIVACNTASSDALRKIQQDYLPKYYPGKKVLGVLIPAAEEAVARTKNKRIGVIATEGTVRSSSFLRELMKIDRSVKIFQNPCPLLVPIVEAGEQNSKIVAVILEQYLKSLKKRHIDTLILGCTHYEVFRTKIGKIVGPRVFLISEEHVVPKKLKHYLMQHPEIEKKLQKKGTVRFFSTDLTEKFTSLGSKFFGRKIKAQKVSLR
jgi:glutamate racemase